MHRIFYFGTELALFATLPALFLIEPELVATLARILCVTLMVASFWMGIYNDRYFAFGFTYAMLSGLAWTVMLFGTPPMTAMWLLALILVAEYLLRSLELLEKWQLPKRFLA